MALLVGVIPAMVEPASADVGTSGNVGDAAGHPYAGWSVVLYGGSGLDVVDTVVTDSAGHWTSSYAGPVFGVVARGRSPTRGGGRW